MATNSKKKAPAKKASARAVQAAAAVLPDLPERGVRMAILGEMLNRIQWAQTHGLQYEGDRDLYKVGGYPTTLTFNDFASAWRRDSVAGSIIDMIAETTWRTPPEVTDGGGAESEFSKQWDELAKRLRVWKKFESADKLARIGRYSILLIGTRGGTDSAMASEMGKISDTSDVLYLSAFSERHAAVKAWETDPREPTYGLPRLYSVNLAGDMQDFRAASGSQSKTVEVHASRILHIAEDTLDGEVFGRPALERVWNDLHDLNKIRTSTPEAFWQRVAGMLVAELMANQGGVEIEWSDEDLEELDETLKEMYHDLRRTAYIQGGTLKRLAESEPNPKEASLLPMRCIAAGIGVPMRVIFGSETGERASSEDQKHYLGKIGERQVTHAEPVFVRAFIDRLIVAGALKAPAGGNYDVAWQPLFKEDEGSVAKANRDRAETARALTPVGSDPMVLIEIDKQSNVWLKPFGSDDESPFEAGMMSDTGLELGGGEGESIEPAAEEGGGAVEGGEEEE